MRVDEFGMGFREYAIPESVSMDIIYPSLGRLDHWSRCMSFEISRTRHINSYTAHLWIYEMNDINPSNAEDHTGSDQASLALTARSSYASNLQLSLIPIRGHGN
ncbi:hypothetical protein CY34DRAFT_362245 [Suillus luteus UH-Slu-Lm8-n1]|uniref:Uncharacterized protein n=1 Tax=Suillus luteus UH-Slu-Lm8-n1 TaxID=930992 RepID=A0A0D0B575_9AGAM|nr:hypothetical protein CY34DRAFT_362245 [Suillus luteus UH-Slu-Lm8-n1]